MGRKLSERDSVVGFASRRRPEGGVTAAANCVRNGKLKNALVIAMLLALGGCGGADRQGVEIRFWAMGTEGEKLRPLIEEFESRHPDVRVRMEAIPWNAAHEKLLTALAGDSLPDMCQLGNTWIAEFAALGSLEDLTDAVGRSEAIPQEAYFPRIWRSNVIDGRLRGVPWYVDTRLLLYRTDLLAEAGFDAPPTSWREWLDVMRVLKRRRGKDRFATLMPINEFEQPIILALQAGSTLLDPEGRRGDFEGVAFRRAFEFYVGLFREGLAPSYSNTQISNVWQEFAKGTFVFYPTGPWNVHEFRNRLGPEMEDKWSTMPWPSPDGKEPGLSIAGGCSLAMFRTTRHSAAVRKVIEFLSGREAQAEMFRLTGNLPAREDAWDLTDLATDQKFAAFRRQFDFVRPTPPVAEWEQIAMGEVAKTAEEVILGETSIDDALAALDKRVDQMLEKRRWILDRRAAEVAARAGDDASVGKQ